MSRDDNVRFGVVLRMLVAISAKRAVLQVTRRGTSKPVAFARSASPYPGGKRAMLILGASRLQSQPCWDAAASNPRKTGLCERMSGLVVVVAFDPQEGEVVVK